MMRRTNMAFGLFGSSAKKTLTKAEERAQHWKLVKYRIGPASCGFGLDCAGNVIFSRFNNGSQLPFGWGIGNIESTDVYQDAKNMASAGTMLSGVPIHCKAGDRMIRRATKKHAKLEAKEESSRSRSGKEENVTEDGEHKSETDHSKPKSSVPPLSKYVAQLPVKTKVKLMRASSLLTWCYKLMYLGLLVSSAVLTWYYYLCFKFWLNPPAREGLHNIETYFLKGPRYLYNSGRQLVNEYLPDAATLTGEDENGENIADRLFKQLPEEVQEVLKDGMARKDAVVEQIKRQSSTYEAKRLAEERRLALELEAQEREEERLMWGRRAIQAVCLALIALCLL